MIIDMAVIIPVVLLDGALDVLMSVISVADGTLTRLPMMARYKQADSSGNHLVFLVLEVLLRQRHYGFLTSTLAHMKFGLSSDV